MQNQRGITLIEVLVAMTILGIVSVSFLSALTTSSRAAISNDRVDTGRAIAQAQTEWVKGQSFLSSGLYSQDTALMEQYPGYSVTISSQTAAERDAFIQTITVAVFFGDKEVSRLQNCKVKR